ncbi:MAG: hypothetical protein RQ743_13760, partial [Bacteroidales bacterium]|nr:hypothetical protein [Bacteroidales bacterium]
MPNRITIIKTDPANPVIDIANTYIGQGSITTLGTIGAGTWRAGVIEVKYGGTGLTTFGGVNTLLYTSSADVLSSIG